MAIQNPDKFRIAIATAQKEENNMTNNTASSNNFQARTEYPSPYIKKTDDFVL